MTTGGGRWADELGLTPELLTRLDRLMVQARRSMVGRGAGLRRSPRPGTSIEFADFRTYVPGDDFRRVDWNAFGRLDRLLLRLYLGEEDIALNLFVDVSRSMEFGRHNKGLAARRLAGALAYVGLTSYDRVAATAFAAGVVGRMRAVRGRAACPLVWRFLAGLPSGGETDFAGLAASPGMLSRGVSVIISDFMTESDPSPALARLRQSGQEVMMLQVLAAEELEPELSGDITVRDVETGRGVELTITPTVVSRYAEALREHTERLRAVARAHDATFERVPSGAAVDTVLLNTLRRAGMLR